MVRGVNRYIIEINSSENKYFDKAIFFVKPAYDGESNEKLRSEGIKLADKSMVRLCLSRDKESKKRRKYLPVFTFIMGIIAACAVFMLKSVII